MPKTAAAKNGDADEDVIMSNNDDAAALTPAAASNNPTESKTPVSSGGMTMRSGKKKKRSAFTATTPSRKRANKRSAKDTDEEGVIGAAAAKKRKTTKDGTNDNDEDMDTDAGEEGSVNDVEMDNNRMATATKVRFETTKEAVAAAQQLPESDDEEDMEEEEDEEENEEEVAKAQAAAQAQAAAAAAVNEKAAGGGWRRLLTQRLRLPSQHTPGPSSAEAKTPGLVPPPAGGRRLIFDTGVKKKEGDAANAGMGATGTNKLLMYTRTMNSQPSKTKATGSKTTPLPAQQPTTPPISPLQTFELTHELKRDFIKCTMAWLSVLLVFFTLGNVTDVLGDYAWDVRQQSVQWSEWYGLTSFDGEVLVMKESGVNDEATDDDDDEVEVVTVVDPKLLEQAKALLRAQRMNQHDIQVFENATSEMIWAIKMLESVEDELISSSSSSSMPTLDSSVTDPVAITEYIESLIGTEDVVIFSKSYCPYCKATKSLFGDLGVQPTVIELDEIENGSLIQDILSEMTDQNTVPNVFVKGQHVGGNDDTYELAESGELQEMLSSSIDKSSDDMKQMRSKLDSMNSNIGKKQQSLEYWEQALAEVETAFESLRDGKGSQDEVNAALRLLSEASMVPFSAMVIDASDIHIPGEGCKDKDYIPLTTGKEKMVDVVGGVDVDALDAASDAPLSLEDVQTAYNSLIAFAQSTSEALIGAAGPSAHAKIWTQKLVQEECQKEGVDGIPSVQVDLPTDVAKKATMPSSSSAYTSQAASKDIDRLLEIENADRTGKFDYASVVHGARVLRRGPRATSLSLYESLPLVNRLLATLNVRFYGHPPEVALRPTTTLYAKGHCWSFVDEFATSRARSQTQDGLRGEYATLTVALSQAIAVTEVMIDHAPRSMVDGKSALKKFRVIGYEDIGAFGEPWELGSFEYDSKLGLQTFVIPTSLGGVEVPKLKAVSLAVDSNWGAEYSCLYRFRVHGG